MSSLGSRSAVPRLVIPPAPLPRVPVADIGTPCPCGSGLEDAPGNPYSNAGAGFTAGPNDWCDGIWDMRAVFTIVTWDTTKNLQLGGLFRWVVPNATTYAYDFVVDCNPAVGDPTHAHYSIYKVIANVSTLLVGPTTDSNLIAGDEIAFSAVGTTLTIKKNGTTIVTTTDSSVVGHSGQNTMQLSVGAFPGGLTWSVDLAWENFCTNRIV